MIGVMCDMIYSRPSQFFSHSPSLDLFCFQRYQKGEPWDEIMDQTSGGGRSSGAQWHGGEAPPSVGNAIVRGFGRLSGVMDLSGVDETHFRWKKWLTFP